MKLLHWIFALLLGLLALMTVLLLNGGPLDATGTAHPQFDGMNVGGDGLARLGSMGWVMALMQYLTLILIHLLIALGVAPRHRSVTFWILLGLICAVSLAISWGMISSYMDYLRSGQTALVFGFPASTALMLFAVFPGGALLCVLYIWGFRRFVLTLEDEAAYEALRAAAATPRAGADAADAVTAGPGSHP